MLSPMGSKNYHVITAEAITLRKASFISKYNIKLYF